MTKLILGKNKEGKEIYLDDTNFGELAEKRIIEYNKTPIQKISKSKIRGILELVNKIYNDVFYLVENPLDTNHLSDIAYLKVKFAYESAKEERDKTKPIDEFVKQTRIMHLLDQIKTKDEFLLYARYVESLIAYFKFHGGKD